MYHSGEIKYKMLVS